MPGAVVCCILGGVDLEGDDRLLITVRRPHACSLI
jgi:hypothetical protein